MIVVIGASSGFGALAACALAEAGHTVYASMRETAGGNAAQVKAALEYAAVHKADVRVVELDVASQESADAAIRKIVEEKRQRSQRARAGTSHASLIARLRNCTTSFLEHLPRGRQHLYIPEDLHSVSRLEPRRGLVFYDRS